MLNSTGIILLTNVVKCCYIRLFSLPKHLKNKQDFKIRGRITPERESFDHQLYSSTELTRKSVQIQSSYLTEKFPGVLRKWFDYCNYYKMKTTYLLAETMSTRHFLEIETEESNCQT